MRIAVQVLAPLAAAALFALAGCAPSPVIVPVTYGEYSVFAWNDLGMHCLSPSYDQVVILPPYNTLIAQVVKRGSPPELMPAGITVEYSVENNTRSYGKRFFGQFWDNCLALFGVTLAHDTGLNLVDPAIHNGLTGTMLNKGGQYQVNGIPVVPVDDANKWNPYQVAVITAKDGSGAVVATTKATIPTSDEINCLKCHDSFADIIEEHESGIGAARPVLCARCHGSPALGTSGPGTSGKYLSQAIHGRHAGEGAQCYDCHPGATTKCNRSTRHTTANGNCTLCHGSLSTVASSIGSGRTPWEKEPKCVTCHAGVAEVDTAGPPSPADLYRNSFGHGGMSCAACHGSPHAMIPTDKVGSFTNWDSYQADQYQGYSGIVKSMGSCGVCHPTSRGWDLIDFPAAHGGPNPKQMNGCYACHTSVPSATADIVNWPHQFQWKDSNQD
jgi:hypothetical protein